MREVSFETYPNVNKRDPSLDKFYDLNTTGSINSSRVICSYEYAIFKSVLDLVAPIRFVIHKQFPGN